MAVARDLPTEEAQALIELTRHLAAGELAPRVAEFESRGEFPREVFRTLGRSGLLGLAYPEEVGGGGQPFETYLQVLEELASSWLAVALGVSVHTLSCHATFAVGTAEQKAAHLPAMTGGDLLGAYCLSESQSGSDAAGLSTKATLDGETYLLNGAKAWITHGGVADFYTVIARTGEHPTKGVTAFLVDGDVPGLSAAAPERKMGMRSSTTAQVLLDNVKVPLDRRLGEEGQGFAVAMSALDSGRLGIAACGVELAQSALDYAVTYARERKQFGAATTSFQGVSFTLADMATQVEASRALYLAAARRRDRGLAFGTQAAMAKLLSTDTAMSVTTNAIQMLGGAGYVEDHPVERYFREAKVLQIVEGTNQIQRLVIGRAITS